MIGRIKTEADLARFLGDYLNVVGNVQMRAVSGPLPGDRITTPFSLPVLAADPDAIADTALLYTVLTGGKVDLRVRFPTGTPITVAIEV